jgi:hypothetical protein
MRHRRPAGLLVGAVGLLGVLAGVAPAVGATPTPAAAWTKLGGDENTVTVVPSIALDGTRVVAAWSVPSPATTDAQAATITPSLGSAGRAPQVLDIVSGWASIDSPVLLGRPGGGLQVMLNAFHSLVTGDPLTGVSFAPRNADGTWGPPVASGANGGTTAILSGDGATPFFATASSGTVRLYRGSTSPVEVDLASALGTASTYQVPRLGRDGTGRYWIAWYADDGLHMVQLDPTSGAVAGTPGLAPQSAGISNAMLSLPLACGPVDCRLAYHQTRANGTDTGRILTWAAGEATATVAVSGADPASNLGAAYSASGRLWIVWYDRSTTGLPAYRATLGNARGAGGAARSLGVPARPASYSAGAISPVDAGGDLAIVTNFERNGVYNQWFTVAAPPAAGDEADTSGIANPQVIRRGTSTFVIPRHPSRASLRRTKCVKVRVQTTKPAVIRVAIFSGRRSVRVFGATTVRFARPGKRLVCIRVPLRAHTFDVRDPFRFAFAVRLGAHPPKRTKTTLTTSGFLNFR